MFSKLLLALSLIATLLHLSSCIGSIAVATSSKKQTVTFQLPNEKSKLYVNDSFYGQGATLKIKVPKTFNTKVRIETEGYKTMHNVLPLYKKSSAVNFVWLSVPTGALLGTFTFSSSTSTSTTSSSPTLSIRPSPVLGVLGAIALPIVDLFTIPKGPKRKKYNSTAKYTKIYPKIERQKEQKEVLLNSFSLAVPKEKNTVKKITAKKYFQNPEREEKNKASILNPEGQIKGESVVLYNVINKKLAEGGFIDTTNEKLLKSKANSLYLESEATEIEKILIENSGIKYAPNGAIVFIPVQYAMVSGHFYYKLTCKWTIKDSYNNVKKEISIKSNSGIFTFDAFSKTDSSFSGAFTDAAETNLHELFENQEFKALLKAENANENANTVVQNITRPAQKPQSFEDAMQACATILVEKNKEKGHGSGFFISTDGYLITNYHVVANMDKITVKTNDGKTHSAKMLRFDFENDLALLKIEATSPFAFEIPADKNYKIGIDVFTIGTPSYESLGQTLSKGILSGARTSEVGNEVLQTDVSVNPGNSGGPLLNKEFQLIGVVNSKLMGRGVEGIAFGSAAKDLLKQLNLAY